MNRAVVVMITLNSLALHTKSKSHKRSVIVCLIEASGLKVIDHIELFKLHFPFLNRQPTGVHLYIFVTEYVNMNFAYEHFKSTIANSNGFQCRCFFCRSCCAKMSIYECMHII